MPLKKEHIGSTHYSQVLDRNVVIKEGASDCYYNLIGLGYLLEAEAKIQEVEDIKEDKKKRDSYK